MPTSLQIKAGRPRPPATGDAELAELIERVGAALRDRDRDLALFLLVRGVAGDPLTEELPVHDPEDGRLLGSFVPSPDRRRLRSAEEHAALAADQHEPDDTIARLLDHAQGAQRTSNGSP